MNKKTSTSRYLISAALALGLAGYSPLPARAAAPAGATVWNFDKPGEPLSASAGTATLNYRDMKHTGWGPMETTFSHARALDLPLVNGVNAAVLAFPATDPDQGYTLVHNSRPNGAYAKEGYVSNYTLVMDIFLKFDGKKPYLSLYQTSTGNYDDADVFIENKPGGGVGVDYVYQGSLGAGAWHRLALAVQCNAGTSQMLKFVDGRFVGGQHCSANGERCRWTLEPAFLLFTDNNGETDPGFLASLMYVDRALSMKELAALGGPSGRGADIPGPVLTSALRAAGKRVRVIGHRGDSGSSPENTLAGIKQAFDDGAEIVQVDVRLSSDGVPVLMHDTDVRRTTDGSGAVFGKSVAELKQLDAGFGFDARYAGERIPTLAEALRTAKGRGKLFLDAKSPGMGRYIQKALQEAEVSPEDIWLLQGNNLEANDYRKNLRGATLFWDETTPGAVSGAAFAELKRRGVAGFDIDEGAVTRKFVDAAHAAGLLVTATTVIDPDRMLHLIDLGVDAMETPYPAALSAMLPRQ